MINGHFVSLLKKMGNNISATPQCKDGVGCY